MILNEWAEQCWGVVTLRPKTLRDYKYKYAKHIAPVFGDRDLESISRRDVQSWVLKLSATEGKANLPILKTLYREALNYDITDHNPTIAIRKKPHTVPRRDFVPWDQLQHMDFGRYTESIRFIALHGFRWGEAIAIEESDIRHGYVYLNRSVYGPTKSKQGRKVPYLGHFPKGGVPKSYTPMTNALKAQTGCSIHSLRKTYAHLLKTQGVHVQVAQRLLGHSTITLTMDIYTDVLDSEIDDAANLLAGIELKESA